MAEHLSKARAHIAIQIALCAGGLWLVLAPLAFAQQLSDPTRPPAALAARQEQGTASAAPVLQSVLISPLRTIAIIDGQTVRVGEKLGDARVTRITEDEVVLRNGQDVQVLKLFPSIEKRLTSSRAITRADSR